jgi:hypothetical protein
VTRGEWGNISSGFPVPTVGQTDLAMADVRAALRLVSMRDRGKGARTLVVPPQLAGDNLAADLAG